jgi:hypothetical protein
MSIVVRRLVNVDDAAFSTGLGGVDSITYGTIAVLFRPFADPVWHWLVKLHDISGVELGGIGVLSDSRLYWAGASIWWTEGPAVTFGDWHVLVARKNAGDLKPRFSLKNVTTGIWVHADGTETQLDWVAPSGGSIRTKDATSGEGPNADYVAAAIWANELPWAADTFGDAAIEAANLDEHLDNWRDQDPASGWEFSQTDTAIMVEDWTLNRADETSVGMGTPTTVTDLDFVFADAGILALSRNFLRSTQDEPGAGGIIRDLSETQGTPTTVGSGLISSGGFTKVLEFWRVVGTSVDASVAIDTSISMSAVSASTLQYQWIVHRYNSADVLQESSTPSSPHNTVGVKTQTMVLAGPFVAGDKLSISLWLRKASGGGSRSFTLNINNADSWVEFSVAEVLPANVTAAIPLAVSVGPSTAADHAVTANVPLSVALAGTATAPGDAPAEVTTTIPLSVAVAGIAEAQHQVTTGIGLTVAVAGTAEADHNATAAIPLTLSLAPVVDAPAGVSEVTAAIPLTLTVAPTSQAEHDITAGVPLTLTVAAVVDAPDPGAPNQVTASIPLELTVAGQIESAYQVAAAIPLTVTLVGTTGTTPQVSAPIGLSLTLAPVGSIERDVSAAIALSLVMGATTATQILERRGLVAEVEQLVATATGGVNR